MVYTKYLVEKLEASGMSQSKLDLFFFIGKKVVCISYVNDLLFWSKDETHINELVIFSHLSGVDLEKENYDEGFLGVRIEHNKSSLLQMKQEGLIDYVIEA